MRQFLRVKDVAELQELGEVAVRAWIGSGDPRAVHAGREWRIAPRDLESFLERHANRPSHNRGPDEGQPGSGG